MQIEFHRTPADGSHKILVSIDFYDMAARKETLYQQIHDAIQTATDDFSQKLTSDIGMAIVIAKQRMDEEMKYERQRELAQQKPVNPKSGGSD